MSDYIGSDIDKLIGGGSFNAMNIGMEIYNFKPYNENMYGFVQPSGRNGSIQIEKLGAMRYDDLIKNILVIWTAPHPNGGTYIVGWYKNATVYRVFLEMKNHNRRNNYNWYNIVTKSGNAQLLPIDERIFRIPRAREMGKNRGMGQSNVWYAQSESLSDFREEVIAYVKDYGQEPSEKVSGKETQADPQKRQKIERIAIDTVWNYYEKLGFDLKSVEKDNVGWDLEAEQRDLKLKIEVKGLSGKETIFELTPNEYFNLKDNFGSYRLAVVTNCLAEPILSIYYYISEENKWGDKNGNRLTVKEIISARFLLI